MTEEPEVEEIDDLKDAYVKSYGEWFEEALEVAKEKIPSPEYDEYSLEQRLRIMEIRVDVAKSILAEVGRAKRQDKIEDQQQVKKGSGNGENNNKGKPASDKQLDYLKSLQQNDTIDISVPKNPTKKQASKLIDKALHQKPATGEQKKQMDKMNIQYPSDISQAEASKRIDDRIENSEN